MEEGNEWKSYQSDPKIHFVVSYRMMLLLTDGSTLLALGSVLRWSTVDPVRTLPGIWNDCDTSGKEQ